MIRNGASTLIIIIYSQTRTFSLSDGSFASFNVTSTDTGTATRDHAPDLKVTATLARCQKGQASGIRLWDDDPQEVECVSQIYDAFEKKSLEN